LGKERERDKMKTALYFVVLLICAGAIAYITHESIPNTAANTAAVTVMVITGFASLIGIIAENLE
jgi:hypothetical protein